MRDTWPDVFEIWGVTWAKEGKVWVGPAITDPEDPMLATAVACERIIRRDGRDVMVDPGLTLDRFDIGAAKAEARRQQRHTKDAAPMVIEEIPASEPAPAKPPRRGPHADRLERARAAQQAATQPKPVRPGTPERTKDPFEEESL